MLFSVSQTSALTAQVFSKMLFLVVKERVHRILPSEKNVAASSSINVNDGKELLYPADLETEV